MSRAAFDVAVLELGTAEIFGALDNPRILEYHQQTSLKAQSDEVAWCASFVNWCLRKAGVCDYKGRCGTNSARARSFLDWGREVPLEAAKRGDIVVLSRGSNPAFGHVGFFAGREQNTVLLLGGNQAQSPVSHGRVSIASYPTHRIISIRRAS